MFNIYFTVERWKWNADFELYVSNKGHFRNRDKKDVPIQISQGGYCSVYCGGTVHRHLLAHRVVMLTWRPTPNAEHLTVDHRDHNKRNNSVDNLEWVTKTENIRRAKADELKVVVEGDPTMVEKVDVSITPKVQSAPTKYDFYLKLNGKTVITVKDFANLFFKLYGGSCTHPTTHTNCRSPLEFRDVVVQRANGNGKLFGFVCEMIPINKNN